MRKGNLKALFEPKTVAVIGASRREESVGYAVLNNLINAGFKGEIYPVNPKATSIRYLHCYAALEEIPDRVDLAVLIVPSTAMPETLRACARKGVQAAIVISAGFREIGPQGLDLENQVVEIAREAGIALLGPNCLGLINTDSQISMNASFSRTTPRAGNIAFVSQSGALCTAILDYAKGEHIGFSKFVSLGNKSDINELDILRYLKDDPRTDVILMYLEDLVNGRLFIETAREITGDLARTKPILAIKAGRTPQGALAAKSHTGSLMGSDEVYDAIFAQAGVLRIDSVQEMFDLAIAFANEPLPKGRRVAIVTNAGGPGIMATDACVRYGLEVSPLRPSTQQILRQSLPPTANVSNPVDVIGDAQHDRYEKALAILAADPDVDSVLLILTPQAMTDIEEIARSIVRFDKEVSFPVVACFMGVVDVSQGVKILEENSVPHYRFPEQGARALAAMHRYKGWIDRPRTDEKTFSVDRERVRGILERAAASGESVLPAHDSMSVLKAYGFPVLPFALARNQEEAVEKSRAIGYPVALKVVSQVVVHKSDVGGVQLNLASDEEVKAACGKMMRDVLSHSKDAVIDGILVQAMGLKGQEVILGMNRDAHFGPVLMFGLGGIYVEALKDVTFRLAPIRALGAKHMMESIRAFPLLTGLRGTKPADLKAVSECLERLSQLACEQPQIKEIDINPLLAYAQGQGACVLDARIVI